MRAWRLSRVAPLGLLVFTACVGFVPTRRQPRVGTEYRFEAEGSPMRLAVRATDGRPTVQYCVADLVQGHVSTILADTVIFNRLTRVDPAASDRGLCHMNGAARLVIPDRSQVRMSSERLDMRRVLLLGAVVGYTYWIHTRF